MRSVADIEAERTCRKCGRTWPIEAFCYDRGRPTRRVCHECHLVGRRAHCRANREKYRAYWRAYARRRKDDPAWAEDRRLKDRVRYWRNRNARIARQRVYDAARREQKLAYARDYYRRNRERVLARQRAKRSA